MSDPLSYLLFIIEPESCNDCRKRPYIERSSFSRFLAIISLFSCMSDQAFFTCASRNECFVLLDQYFLYIYKYDCRSSKSPNRK